MKKPALHMPNDRKFFLLLGGNLLVLTLIGFFAVRPAIGLLVKRTAEITTVKAEIAGMEDKTARLRQLEETFPKYEATYTPILQSIPKEKDLAGYQAELESLAQTAAVSLGTVDFSGGKEKKPGAATTTTGFPATPVTLDVTGTFATVYDFVSRLETMSRFTKVTEMSLSADASGVVKAQLSVQTFYVQ